MTPVGTIDPSSLTVTVSGNTARLTPQQYAMFEALYRAKGRTVSTMLLTEVVEGVMGREINSNVVGVQLHRLRQHLKPLGLEIYNTWGKGFSLPKLEFEVLPEIEWVDDLPAIHRGVGA